MYEKIEQNILGTGGNSTVYLCKRKDQESNKKYAMKFSERMKNSGENPLKLEYKIMKYLVGGIGIPKVYYLGKENNSSYLVMQLLGKSVEEVFKSKNNKFSKEFFKNVANQMISRIEFLHSKGFIHCDIKPENFVFGRDNNSSTIYLIDYGLAEPYINFKTGEHKKYCDKIGHKGTLNYCSLNSHIGASLSRRDDLESLAYCLIYLWCGKLPWIKGMSNETYSEQIMNSKMELCSAANERNIPKNLLEFLDYSTKLKFEQLPDYRYLKKLINSL